MRRYLFIMKKARESTTYPVLFDGRCLFWGWAKIIIVTIQGYHVAAVCDPYCDRSAAASRPDDLGRTA